MKMKVFVLAVTVCLSVVSCEVSSVTHPQFNDVADVKLEFHGKHNHRDKRKILDLANAPAKKWPTTIEYFLNTSLTDAEKRLIKTTLTDDFEANTCLQFTELASKAHAEHQFMLFTHNKEASICRAYIGRNNDTTTFNGQPLYLGDNCFNYKGTLVHMIAATLGMYNEVQRPDREEYAVVQKDNIAQEGKEYFVRQSEEVIHYHGTPYDYGSAVHYSTDAWLKDSLKLMNRVPSADNPLSYTVRPKDPKLFRLLGQKSELSFYDIEVINHAYCAHKCVGINVTCSNGGYQDPNNCAECKCPDGYTGEFCDNFPQHVADKTHQCTPVNNVVAVTEEETCVSSPGYEQGDPYTTGESCTWVLEAPQGMSIDMWFYESRFALPYASTAYSFCLHWVEVKYKGLDTPRGARFCSLDQVLSRPTLPTKFSPLTSQSSKVMVLFKSPQAHLQAEYIEDVRKGFKLCFKQNSTIPSTTTASLSTSSAGESAPSPEMSVDEPPSTATSSLTPLIVGIIAALLLVLIIFGVIIVVLLYKRKRKRAPPVVTSDTTSMENPGYAQAAPVVTFHNPDSEKTLAVLDAFGVSMDDLPPKYEDIPPEDNVPRYTYAYSASPVSSEPSQTPASEYQEADGSLQKDERDPTTDGPVYQNAARAVSIKNLRSKFEQ